MGLIFILSKEDMKICLDFFLSAYTKNEEKFLEMFLQNGANLNEAEKGKFRKEIEKYFNINREVPITAYFTEMMNICFAYNIVPPDFLFKMAKAFICLNGINVFSNNETKGFEMVKEQVIEYYVRKNIKKYISLIKEGLVLAPSLVSNTYKYGLMKAVSKEMVRIEEMYNKLNSIYLDCKDFVNIFNN